MVDLVDGHEKLMETFMRLTDVMMGDVGPLDHGYRGIENVQDGFEKLRETFVRLTDVMMFVDGESSEDPFVFGQSDEGDRFKMAGNIKPEGFLDEREKVVVDDKVVAFLKESPRQASAADNHWASDPSITIPGQQKFSNKHKPHRVKSRKRDQ